MRCFYSLCLRHLAEVFRRVRHGQRRDRILNADFSIPILVHRNSLERNISTGPRAHEVLMLVEFLFCSFLGMSQKFDGTTPHLGTGLGLWSRPLSCSAEVLSLQSCRSDGVAHGQSEKSSNIILMSFSAALMCRTSLNSNSRLRY